MTTAAFSDPGSASAPRGGTPDRTRVAGRPRKRTAPRLVPYVFLAPALVLFSLFFLLPIGYAAYQSLRKVKVSGLGLGKGSRTEVFAGVENYTAVLSNGE